MELCAMKLHGIRKNPNKFGFFTQLDKFLTLRKANKLAFPSLNRNFVVILQPKI